MIDIFIDFFLLGVAGALLGIFYRNCLKSQNMIFNVLYYKVFKPIVDKAKEDNALFKDKLLSFIMYPLGYCVYCSSTWITFILCAIWLSNWEILPNWQDIVIGIVIASGVQHYILMTTCKFILFKHPDL